MAINFPLVLKNLDDKLYPQQELRDFVDQAGISMILMKYASGVRYTKRLMEKILQDDTLFDKILFAQKKEDQEQLEKLYQKVEFQIVISKSIEQHYRAVANELNTAYELEDKTYYTRLVSIFITFISQDETEVGMNIVRSFQKMLVFNLLKFMLVDETIYELFLQGMKHETDAVRMRYMEVIMAVSNSSEEAHEKLVSKKILDLCIAEATTQDILLRLASVEIISKMGDKPYNSKYLAEHPLMKELISEAFNPKQELYVKKYLALLISKLISQGAMKFSIQLKQNFLNLLATLFFQGLDEEKFAAIDIISHLAMTQDGIDVIVIEKKILAEFMKTSQITKQSVKQKFLSAFTNFFYKSSQSEKSPKLLCNLLICLGKYGNIDDSVDMYQSPLSLEDIKLSMEYIYTILFQPFPEMELEALYFIKNLIQWEVICRYFIGHAKCVDYFVKQFAKNGEILNEKKEILSKLTHLCSNVYNKEHIQFKQFVEQVNAAKESQKKNDKQKDDEVLYGLQNM